MHSSKLIGIALGMLVLTSCEPRTNTAVVGIGEPVAPGGITGPATQESIATLHIADMDGDGKPDIVYSQKNTIFILKNNGNMDFTRVTPTESEKK